jgi:UDP-N-acetylmuramoyl-L-alanyl-D-glutamate--2,6-diaminopimelate ligase
MNAQLPRPATAPVALGALARAAGGSLLGDGAGSLGVTGITHDSREVRAGDVFAALPGARTHGARFADDVVAAGAVAFLTDSTGAATCLGTGRPTVVVEEVRAVLGEVAALVYGSPAQQLTVLGVTGTNGKTTTVHLLEAALRAAGRTVAIIGTLGTRIDDEQVHTVRTTPESTDLHALLALMLERGVTDVVMEVSSHALSMGRVDGVVFDAAGFTNLTQDHLDFHGDMEAYFQAKASLFTPRRSRSAVVCVDDDWGRRLADATTLPVVRVSARSWDAPLVLAGAFNRQNAALALAMAEAVGVERSTAQDAIAAFGGVPGRMEVVADDRITAIVDYAHTPDAIARALGSMQRRPARLIAVLGAGGDRDPSKRQAMGAAAARLADLVVVTDDNPRSEDAAAIRAAVRSGAEAEGAGAVVEVAGRREAIAEAVASARQGDVVMVLGKGHEEGQEVDGVVTPFDDRAELRRALAASRGRP